MVVQYMEDEYSVKDKDFRVEPVSYPHDELLRLPKIIALVSMTDEHAILAFNYDPNFGM